jgi:hypothetical protein
MIIRPSWQHRFLADDGSGKNPESRPGGYRATRQPLYSRPGGIATRQPLYSRPGGIAKRQPLYSRPGASARSKHS